jgi:hypothetical protein
LQGFDHPLLPGPARPAPRSGLRAGLPSSVEPFWSGPLPTPRPRAAIRKDGPLATARHPAEVAMHVYFSGRLLTATDFGAEQEASLHRGAGAAEPATSSDLHAGAPGETLAHSPPASRCDAVALNPQPLPPKDINELVQWVLRESYTSTTEDLRSCAEKVKHYNEAKMQVRDELHHTREALGEVDSHIKGLEDKLNSVGDDAQLANVDLQNVLQKQQQTLQLMSNISKQLYDTVMGVIRKIGG